MKNSWKLTKQNVPNKWSFIGRNPSETRVIKSNCRP